MKALYRLLLALIIALALDGLTKAYAERMLAYHDPLPFVGEVFRLTLSYNSGVTFGLFAGSGPWPVIVTGVAIMGLVAWLVKALHSGELSPAASWPAGLLVGGAIANLFDRLADGRVTDFLDVGIGTTRWPAFNLADSFVVLGVAVLMALTFLEKRSR